MQMVKLKGYMHYYFHHIGDFIKATSRLTDSQAMAYLRLIWLYYEQEKPLINDKKILAFQVGSDEETIDLILKSYFKLDGDLWHQNRCDELIEAYQKQSLGGKKGAMNRWGKQKGGNSLPITTPLTTPMPSLITTNNHKPITNNQSKNIVARPEGLSDMVWSDYLTLRNKKRSPLTKTALAGLEKQAKLANMTLEDVLRTCCERGWIGFKAEWADAAQNKKELPLGNEQQIAYAYAHECGGDPTKARFNSYWEMRDFILKFRDKKKNA